MQINKNNKATFKLREVLPCNLFSINMMLNVLYTYTVIHFLHYIFRWGTHLFMSLFPSVRPSVHPSVDPSVHCAPYLRNHTSYDHNFWYTCVK